jgi:hypothetical protein
VAIEATRDFWSAAAMDLLTCLFLAAARAEWNITQVHAWLADTSNPEAVSIPDGSRGCLGRGLAAWSPAVRLGYS